MNGAYQILTPTEGVDFSDYMARVLASVRRNWYAVMPESAQLGDRGRVVLEFSIRRDGSVPNDDPQRLLGSGKEPLDRAAVSAIRSSNPFDHLPPAFSGPEIRLRFIFLYNLPLDAANHRIALRQPARTFEIARENRPPTSCRQHAAGRRCSGHSSCAAGIFFFDEVVRPRIRHWWRLWVPPLPENPHSAFFWRKNLAAKSSLAIRHSSIAVLTLARLNLRSDELAERCASSARHSRSDGRIHRRRLSRTRDRVLDDLRARSESAGLHRRDGACICARCSMDWPICRCARKKFANVCALRLASTAAGICTKCWRASIRNGRRNKFPLSDEQKLIRAIEICLLAQKPLSEVHRAGRNPLTGWRDQDWSAAGPRKRSSAHSCTHRHDVASRLARGSGAPHWPADLPENAKPFHFIGYRELRSHLRGEIIARRGAHAIQQGTRQYAKRQLTWFRREANVHWLAGFRR